MNKGVFEEMKSLLIVIISGFGLDIPKLYEMVVSTLH